MSISASRVAAVVAARLAPAAPPPFHVRAVGRSLQIDHPAGWGFTMLLAFIEDEQEDRGPADLLRLVVDSALNSLQDAVSEATKEPWPPFSPTGRPRAMAPYHTRWDGENLHFWYGVSEDAPAIAFTPISLQEVDGIAE